MQGVLLAHGIHLDDALAEYLSEICNELVKNHCRDEEEWNESVGQMIADHVPSGDTTTVCRELMLALTQEPNQTASIAEKPSDEICIDPLLVAFMGNVLVERTRLVLRKGKFYGLVGRNGAGKTTLMKMIANHSLPNFPPNCRVSFIEHEISASDDMNPIQFIVRNTNISEEEAKSTLSKCGFNEKHQNTAVSLLSGGYKMRLALAQVTVIQPDVLLLDEPTNHLDVHAVKWLIGFVKSLRDVIVIIVSHDPEFLTEIVTDILYLHDKQLTTLNDTKFDAFLEQHAADIASLDDLAPLSFPDPGPLPGVTSRSRTVMKLTNASFRYAPTADNVLNDVTVKVTLASRIGVVGVNGAGKSTLVKLLVGELLPTVGSMWKHHNLRVAYVAQHHFHHLEQHQTFTPLQYVQKRFAKGYDSENLTMANLQISEQEEQKITAGRVEAIMGRRTRYNHLEYEVKWIGLGDERNSWHTLETLEKLGATKLALQFDELFAAQRAGVDTRPLHNKEVLGHLAQYGLLKQSEKKISLLSAGQKARLALACVTWSKPHLIMFDEPTNYLDKHSLDLVKKAIVDFPGCIIMVSHHISFISDLCKEVWQVNNHCVSVAKPDDDKQTE
eukprot:c9342_g1_i2.p1 GENE.c9342_g1_i2~~c9342_g1_i2.p1  ORF type:complete len:613 (+),score=157.32 c9342_g1_i2:43-1881(+)